MNAVPPILRRRLARRLLVAAFVLVVARAMLPLALELAIEWGGERASGLPIEVGDVDLALLRGGAAIEDVAVAGVDAGRTPQGAVDPDSALVRFDRLAVNFQWLSLLRGRIHLSELEWAGPVLALELDAFGNPRLPASEDDAEPEADAATAESEGSGWPIWLDRVEIRDAGARVADPLLAGPEPAVRAGLGALELTDLRVDGGSVGLGGVGLRDPQVHVRRDFVLADRPRAEEPIADEAPDREGAAPAHRVERIGIERAEFNLITDGGSLAIALRVDARDVTTARGETFPVDLSVEIDEGELTVEGRAGVDPPVFAGTIAWQGLPFPPMALAANPELASWLRSARASGRLDVEFGGPVGDALVLRGDARVDDFDFRQPDGDDVALSWKSLSVQLDELALPLGDGAGAPRVEIAEVAWVDPVARFTLPASSLDALLAGGEDAADPTEDEADASDEAEETPTREEATPPEAADPARVRVGTLSVSGGDLHFVDRTVRPVFEGRVTRLAVSASELRLPEQRAGKLRISGLAPGGAAFTLDGVPDEGGRIDFNLERLDLAQFNPYTAGAAGYHLTGSASLDTELEVGRNTVDVGNQLQLHGIGLDAVGEDVLGNALGMPVDLALALLRDLSGNIRLGIPVSVDRRGVRVSLAAVLRDAVRAAIAGAVMAPLKLADAAASPLAAFGKALSRGGDDVLSIPPLAAVPGAATLSDGQVERVESLVGFLKARPALKLILHGRSDPSDRDGLALRILIETAQSDGDLPEVEGAGFFERRRIRGYLAAVGRGEAPEIDEDDRDLLDRYVFAVSVPPGRFEQLALRRAEALQSELVERYSVEAARLEVAGAPESDPPGIRIALGAL